MGVQELLLPLEHRPQVGGRVHLRSDVYQHLSIFVLNKQCCSILHISFWNLVGNTEDVSLGKNKSGDASASWVWCQLEEGSAGCTCLLLLKRAVSWLKYTNDTEGRDKTFGLALLYLGHPYQNFSNFSLFKAYCSERYLFSIWRYQGMEYPL